jgi:hypothetical protein
VDNRLTVKTIPLAAVLAFSCLIESRFGPVAEAAPVYSGTQNRVLELAFRSSHSRSTASQQEARSGAEQAAAEVELDVMITPPDGPAVRVPAFWAGDTDWKVRYAPPRAGTYRFETICSDTNDPALHGQTGTIEVAPYHGPNPLYQHGPVRVAPDHRHFEHADGTPFFWLGDTWWMGLCQRLHWPEEFQLLTADRVEKGFTVIQIVAGLYPDMPPFDPRGANEAGFPWEPSYIRINPRYFDMADLRIQHLVERGLVPCIVGSWGYFLPKMGVTKVKAHWRYLVARWGAYPVVWCLAGEGTMPDYLSSTKEQDSARQKREWTDVARYLRQLDPEHRLVSIHPSANSRDSVEDVNVLDFDMLQTGHSDRASLPNTIRQVTGSLARLPAMPVVDAEPCYEGILEAGREEVQRLLFWSCVLSGAAGHTYGANGLWQLNTREHPFGPSPHGRSWGDTPWDEAYRLPGSRQLGLGKALLLQYPWWRLEPHPEWVQPHWTSDNYILPYAAGIPGELRIIYTPARWDLPKVVGLGTESYNVFLFSPLNGKRYPLGPAVPDKNGTWTPPVPPVVQDWVLVLQKPQ